MTKEQIIDLILSTKKVYIALEAGLRVGIIRKGKEEEVKKTLKILLELEKALEFSKDTISENFSGDFFDLNDFNLN